MRSSTFSPSPELPIAPNFRLPYRASGRIIGKPDLVCRRKKVAVFIDSDFWHGHPERYPPPKFNQEYWTAKVARNRQRDTEVNTALEAQGWTVLRFWEWDIKRDFDACIARLLKAIGREE